MKADELLGIDTQPAVPVKRGRKKKKTPVLSETWCKKVVALPTEKLVRQREALGTIIVNEYPLECDKPEKDRNPEYVKFACQLAYITKVVETRMTKEKIREARSLREVYGKELGYVTEAFERMITEFRFGNVLCDHANALDKVRELLAATSHLAYKMGGE